MNCAGVSTKGRQPGFTLIELMTVVALVVVLATVGVPSFTQAIRSNSVNSKVIELLGALQVARNEAVTRNAKVTFCKMKADDATVCDNAGSFQNGWIVWTDIDADAVIDTGEILSSSRNSDSQFTFTLKTGSTAINSLTFGAMGTANVTATTLLTVCRGTDYAGQISLEISGRASTSKLTACP